ncbi:hypothetical protein IZ6_14970 [Terrihabitans soli]|uniref:Uncharacterized protein n=1 Tax=Terrihabitans soli TaxID=708113 RepID=A0A6S6QU35_9HYPH|nr:hypothetical protein [Terrihabitans soli]BCJ90762.1 hypothetical protein IZ6_14970 [Terrihabitans soli]
MKISIAVVALVMSLAGGAAAQEAPAPPNLGPPAEPSVAPTADPSIPPMLPAAKKIDVEACPEKGTERGCILIRYGEETYDVTGTNPPVPLNGKGVRLRGDVDPGAMGFCFATGLKNITWEQTILQCPNVSGTEVAPPQNLQVK